MAQQAVSPMMQQYFDIKKQHPDEILFYRVGDFYEMFYDDALTASRELELTLTGKACGGEERAPMCGVPFHSYETYVARLIAKGYKVAICEQMEDPALAKGLVKRDIIRVVTPGTVIESSMLAEDKNNYLCAIYLKKHRRKMQAGVCFADISTGEAYATELESEKMGGAIITELCRYVPSEILINTAMLDLKDVTNYIKQHTSALVELRDDAACRDSVIHATLAGQFGPDWQKTCGFQENGMVPYAVGMLLGYLKETQKHGIERIRTIQNYADAQYMRLSPVTRANLELTETMRGREKKGTLLWVLDKTETSMGKRLLRSWIEQPLVDAGAINARLDAVDALYQENVARADLKEALGRVFDIERLTTRILYGSATPREVCALADTCEALPEVRRIAEGLDAPLLADLAAGIDPLADILTLVRSAIVDDPPANLKDGGAIRAGYNAEVDELRDIMHGGKGFLSQMEARLQQGVRLLHRGQPLLRRQRAGYLYPQADLDHRRAVHHPGTERAGKQDPRRQRAAAGFGAPAVCRPALRHLGRDPAHPENRLLRGPAGRAGRLCRGGRLQQLHQTRGGQQRRAGHRRGPPPGH